MRIKLYAVLLNYKLVLSGLFLSAVIVSSFAYAEAPTAKSKEPLEVTLTAKKVQKDAKGKETLVSADKVKPGEVVEYKAVYANISQSVLNGVMAMLPVPKGMEYVDKSANPATAMATLDDIKTVVTPKYEPIPLKRKVKDKSGKEVLQLVPMAEYQALRWDLGVIQPGKSVTVSARMQVSK